MRSRSYVVLDIETTGLRPGRHGITELYAARIDGQGEIKGEFHSMVNPGHHIPAFITRLTGIDDELVKDAPPAGEVIVAFDGFLRDDDVLVGHNVRFDRSFLDHERKCVLGSPFTHSSLCTMLLARRLFAADPLPSYRLGALAENFGIDTQGAHRAQKDVHMTIALQQALFSLLEQAKLTEQKKVFGLQYLPLRKAAELFTRC